VTILRREVLAALGAASASGLLWALGCGGAAPTVRRAPQVSGEVRTWLHDAVARLAASFPVVHALAVSRRRTTAARDVLGAGIARLRTEGVVLTVRDRDGTWRDHVTTELTRSGVDAAARALAGPGLGTPASRAIDFGPAPTTPAEPPPLDDRDLHRRVDHLLDGDAALARRLVYAAAAIDVDDAIVWSVAPGRDLEQRLVRIRNTAVRAASSGTRPILRSAERAWSGWLDDQVLTADELVATSEAALEVITPGGFDDGERPVVLDPSVVAVVLDTLARTLLTSSASNRPELARRLAEPAAPAVTAPTPAAAPPSTPAAAAGAGPSRTPAVGGAATAGASGALFGSPLVTLIDDPTAPGAYGGFAFDDEGEPAAPLTLLDAGRIAARLSDRAEGGAGRGRRAGHLGHLAPAPSHLLLAPGAADPRQLRSSDGFILEGGVDAALAADGDRIRITCTRARELKGGNTTGRVYSDVELVGSLRALLTAIDAIATDTVTFSPHSGGLWRSISAPAVRTRGFVRAARSRA
jgi:predicted Zn-dependent protease